MLHPHLVNRLYAGLLCLLSCCALPMDGYAAFELEDTDARTVALGGGCVADWEDVGTVGLNPASIAYGKHVRISLTHLRLLPELKDDLDLNAAGAAFPSRWGAFGLGMFFFGSGRWSERGMVLTYARSHRTRVAWGVSAKVLRWRADFSGSGSSYTDSELSRMVFSFDVGGVWDVGSLACVDHFRVGAAVRDLSRSDLSASDDADVSMPMDVLFGGLFEFRPYRGVLDLSLCDSEVKMSGGIERVFPGVIDTFLRIGGVGIPGDGEGGALSFGMGIVAGAMHVDYAYTYSMTLGDLGGNHRMSVGYAF